MARRVDQTTDDTSVDIRSAARRADDAQASAADALALGDGHVAADALEGGDDHVVAGRARDRAAVDDPGRGHAATDDPGRGDEHPADTLAQGHGRVATDGAHDRATADGPGVRLVADDTVALPVAGSDGDGLVTPTRHERRERRRRERRVATTRAATAGVLALAVAGGAYALTRPDAPAPDAAAPSTPSVASASSPASSASPGGASPSAQPSASSPAPSVAQPSARPSPPAAATPVTAPTTPVTVAAGPPSVRARGLVAAFERLYAAGGGGALVATAPLGENVASTPVQVVGAGAAQVQRAVRAGKVFGSGVSATRAASGVVTGPGRRAVRPALMTPAAAVAQLAQATSAPCPTCRAVGLTGPTPTRIALETTAGPVTAPAWSFGVRGSRARVVVSAVAPASWIQVAPPFRTAAPAAVAANQLPLWKVAVSPNGRTVVANIDRKAMAEKPGCWRLVPVESAHAVALTATRAKADATGACAPASGRVAATLPRALGTRTLLDTYWQRAIPAR